MPPLAAVRNEDAIKSQKGLFILGKDIREIPCLRSSLLLGITCGISAGLISFMTTSKVKMSSHIGFGSLWLVVFAYWIPCRYKHETQRAVARAKYAKALAEKNMPSDDKASDEPEKEKN